ncbi:MAG: hypothetical protein K1X72_26900 [Pyrinomonadaceae bacterium]|nr:hypothetical protein [Pyrinomonadaceae bacterium]
MKLKSLSFGIFLLGNLLLLSVCLSFFILPLNNQFPDENLVYCPLQKTWVQQNVPQPKIEDSLENICASDKLKSQFSLQLSQKTLGFQPKTEKLFFNYLQKGDLAFAEINHHPNLPDSNLAQNHKTETVANNFRQEIGQQDLAGFTLQQIARPPTFVKEINFFASQSAQPLDQISRNINPRSPPFSI